MKRIILFSVLMYTSLFSFSQNNFGVIAGINNSSLSDGFLKKVALDKAFSVHLGALYQYKFNESIAFRPKLVVSFQGDRKEGSGGSGSILGESIDYKFSHINIPLNFKFFSKPYIIAGPQVGYLLGTKKENIDFGDIDKKLDYGLNFGFGYDFNKMFIEFNMYQGMAKLIEFESSSFYRIGVTNTVLQLSLGYYFK